MPAICVAALPDFGKSVVRTIATGISPARFSSSDDLLAERDAARVGVTHGDEQFVDAVVRLVGLDLQVSPVRRCAAEVKAIGQFGRRGADGGGQHAGQFFLVVGHGRLE